MSSRNLKLLGTVSLIGIAYYIVIVLILHILRTDINPFRQLTSAYKVGTYGFLMTTAFIVMAVGQGALVLGLYQGVSEQARSRIGLVLLGIWAAGNLIAGLLPTPLTGAPTTITGIVAQINGPLHILCLVVGAFMVSKRFRIDDSWQPIYRPALVLSLVLILGFIAGFITLATDSGFAGLAQRIFIVTALAWSGLLATRLQTSAKDIKPA